MMSKMKKIIIVNNNMKIGGVQKSLSNLLWEIETDYDITLLLFSNKGELKNKIPSSVKVVESGGLFKFFGVSQNECNNSFKDYLLRGLLVLHSRIFGRCRTAKLMLKREPKFTEHYDCAISYLHNGRRNAFYGGTQDYVLHCVDADKKIAFLHGDYINCGANNEENNLMMADFDKIAACSDGCRATFEAALPHLKSKCVTVLNCHNFDEIKQLANNDAIEYDGSYINVIIVARLSHEKGIERAIKAVSIAKDKGIKIKLHIVGNGAMKKELENLVKEIGLEECVIFYGEQNNPYRYMKNADLLLISSYHEAAPMVIDEARCLGIPVLTTKTTSSEEMVEERGCGWVCDNTDHALNEALLAVTSNVQELRSFKIKLMNLNVNNDVSKEQFEKLIYD